MRFGPKKFGGAVLAVALLAGVLVGCGKPVQEVDSGKTVEEMMGKDSESAQNVFYNGAWYQPAQDVESYLIMGVDRSGEATEGSALDGGGQADMLMVLVVNHQEKTYHVLQINRDTMTDVTVLGMQGDEIGTEKMQIAAAHSFGKGLEDSCENTVKAVSNFLYGVSMDGYAAIQMDAIPLINDWAGGVTVTIRDDFSQIDPSLVKGETVTLSGQQAYTFVRGRQHVGDSTNISRMARQVEYFNGLASQVRQLVEHDIASVAELYQTVTPYMVTDMGSGTVTKLAQRCKGYTNGGVVTLEGESKMGEKFMEFYATEDSVKQAVFSLFYTQVQEETK